VKEFFAKFGKGDIPGVLNTMSETWIGSSQGQPRSLYAGQRKEENSVEDSLCFQRCRRVQKFEPREFIAQKDKVVYSDMRSSK